MVTPSPSQFRARVVDTRALVGGYFVLSMEGPAQPAPLAAVIPGQFVMLRGEWGRDPINPRAFSVLDSDGDGRFSVMLKAYGRGTARLCAMRSGEPVTVTGPLGQGTFVSPSAHGPTQLLVAGGVGLPPLHLQARRAAAAGLASRVELLYGGRDRDDLVLLTDFEGWGVRMHLATEDGSLGDRGFVTVPLQRRLQAAADAGEALQILACGPTPMLRAVRAMGLRHHVPTFLCLEEEMACGFGVCLGCAVPVYGDKPYEYCCTEGPVFEARRVRWS
ncbi:dihydroorotate dehydrogenase electron transfer subunit [Paraliomyxa miuraensis]|uniref:dihydroorotate dehydrogenase electron transfer subunit n=1 Tax=Paraliomyxa miuraensis TaxID=376150 RepID=UPI0022532492|nr:dihydroorotate dehydrogenase electron transfer subunit [Paraliomyxa miuraensis]MCX4242377.1 dihydroorotate dehydrogenase electron transfer subunit [Paraliomyxa miuraensis]